LQLSYVPEVAEMD